MQGYRICHCEPRRGDAVSTVATREIAHLHSLALPAGQVCGKGASVVARASRNDGTASRGSYAIAPGTVNHV
jgi:hypothetical protein